VCSGAGFEIVNIPTSSFASVRLPPFKTGSIISAAPANTPIVKPEAAAGAPAIKAAAADATKEAGKGKEKEEKQKGKKDDAKGEKKADASAAAAEGDQEDLDPSKLDIRVGHVVKCWNHPDSEKLLCEEIDLGEGTLRTIASGIRPHYAAEELQGRKVCVLANLKDRNLAGFKSQVW
jgi:methionine--tRNA ligase beta chain